MISVRLATDSLSVGAAARSLWMEGNGLSVDTSRRAAACVPLPSILRERQPIVLGCAQACPIPPPLIRRLACQDLISRCVPTESRSGATLARE
jgi:hypothetical protein